MMITRSHTALTSEEYASLKSRCVRRQAFDEAADFDNLLRVKPDGGLIKNQHVRIMQQGLGNAHALPVPLDKLPMRRGPHSSAHFSSTPSIPFRPGRYALNSAYKLRYPCTGISRYRGMFPEGSRACGAPPGGLLKYHGRRCGQCRWWGERSR